MEVSSPQRTAPTSGSGWKSFRWNSASVLSAGSYGVWVRVGGRSAQGLTVPPRCWMPSSSSSSSRPFIPITYTFLCFGIFITVEMYTADAYADPKTSS